MPEEKVKCTLDLDEYKRNIHKPLDELENFLDSYSDVIEWEYASELTETIQNLQEFLHKFSKDRLLNLGIVGQVNSGKSTFLNALLFGGEEVLPRSATPMTASVTKIQWSKDEGVLIEYFSQSEWTDIEKQAEQYKKIIEQPNIQNEGKSPKPHFALKQERVFRASYELVEMVRSRQIPVQEYLGQEICYEAPVTKLNEILLDLVGVEGKLTPLVKSITIRCKHGIKGLNVIDTPGINDPIISRSRETRQYLRKCDAVLMLSYASQFLEAEDIELFQRRLSKSGIKKKFILSSKFDSALLDVSKKYHGDLFDAQEKTIADLKNRLNEHFKNSNDEVEFISARCTSLLTKPLKNWNGEELEGFEYLCQAYPDWFDEPVDGEINDSTKASLERIGNMSSVEDYIKEVQGNKDTIMKRKACDLIYEKHHSIENLLLQLKQALESNIHDLEIDSIEDAKARIDKLENLIEEIKDNLQEKWNDILGFHLTEFIQFRLKVIKNKNGNFVFLDEVEQDTPVYEEELPGFWAWIQRILGIGGSRVVPYPNNISKSELIKGVDIFIDMVREDFELMVLRMFQQDFRDNSRAELNDIISNCLTDDFAPNLDIEKIKRLIWRAVSRLCELAKDNLKLAKNELYEKTGGAKGASEFLSEETYKMSEMEVIRHIATVCYELTHDLEENLNTIGNNVRKKLMPEINRILKSEIERLEKDLEHREFRLQRYELALKGVSECQAQFKKVNIN